MNKEELNKLLNKHYTKQSDIYIKNKPKLIIADKVSQLKCIECGKTLPKLIYQQANKPKYCCWCGVKVN